MAAICSWTLLPSSEAAERALGEASLQSSGRHVHWLHCASEAAGDDLSALRLLWKGSRGSAAAAARFVLPASDACARAPTCVHAAAAERDAAAWRPRAGLLVGEPGMGKTQFLQCLAAEARAREPQRWAVVVQALRHRHLLQRFPEPPGLSKEHLLDLLTGAACGVASGASLAEVTRRCLRAALEDTGEIAVLVDGVDEICPAYKDKLIRLLEILLETKVQLVWVSSRPEVEVSLSETLRCPASSLRPLSKEEQRNFLCQHWASLHGCSAAVFEPLACEMVDSLLDAEGGSQRSLLDVPLHVQMAAETYEPLAAQMLHAGGGQLPKGAFSLYDLYRRFVDKKRELFKQRFGLTDANFENISLVDNFDEVHQNCAILELVSDGSYGDVNVLPFKNYLENNKRNIIKEKNGILWMEEEGMHRFVHYTFMEYFAASWMVSHINDQGTAFDLAKEIWHRQFHQKRFSKLRHILEHMLSEGLPLHRAVLEGGEGALEAALAAGACDLDARDRLGRTALVQAASLGRGGAVDALLARGCDAGRRDALLGWTALRFASAGAHLDAAERLLQAGASAHHLQLDDAHDAALKAAKFGLAKVMEILVGRDAALKDARKRNNETVLMLASKKGHVETVRSLLAAGAEVWAVDPRGEGALERAVRGGHTAVAALLLAHGGDAGTAGGAALALAARLGHEACARLLLPRHVHHRDDADGCTALHHAARAPHAGVARLLLEHGARVDAANAAGATPLMLAADAGDAEGVELLLGGGAEADRRDRSLRTALLYAAARAHVPVTRLLLQHGADPNAKSKDSRTALLSAVLQDRQDTTSVRLLLEHGADVNHRDADSCTALHHAVDKGHREICKLLLEFGADPNVKSKWEKTPLILAVERGDVISTQLLVDFGADKSERDVDNWTALHFSTWKDRSEATKVLLENEAEPNSKCKRLKIPLMFAALRGNESSTRLLLELGADVNHCDADGCTALHYATWNDRPEITALLLRHGADPNAANKERSTPLMHAAQKGGARAVELLLQHGADARHSDLEGWTALHRAAAKGHRDIARLLLDRGADANASTGNRMTALALAADTQMVELLEQYGADRNLAGGGDAR
ncbi:hypothetical protein R5R35_004619 [Gryllus longicercus]|uniref:NACHT domain-containing protein n=1 Tax=Gryllus longicercus TaxID=2509291 RepID=A0AAN9W0U4_9ORTH